MISTSFGKVVICRDLIGKQQNLGVIRLTQRNAIQLRNKSRRLRMNPDVKEAQNPKIHHLEDLRSHDEPRTLEWATLQAGRPNIQADRPPPCAVSALPPEASSTDSKMR